MDEIELVPYDPSWPLRFAAEATLLRTALDPALIIDIQHFGSTAIVGMCGKPIIDILIAVRSLDEARRTTVVPLDRLGYDFWAGDPKPDRMFFVKGMPPRGARRTHHVHLSEPTGQSWLNLTFRDYLRTHAEDALRYEKLKQHLSVVHRDDREAYTESKAAFVAEIIAKARN